MKRLLLCSSLLSIVASAAFADSINNPGGGGNVTIATVTPTGATKASALSVFAARVLSLTDFANCDGTDETAKFAVAAANGGIGPITIPAGCVGKIVVTVPNQMWYGLPGGTLTMPSSGANASGPLFEARASGVTWTQANSFVFNGQRTAIEALGATSSGIVADGLTYTINGFTVNGFNGTGFAGNASQTGAGGSAIYARGISNLKLEHLKATNFGNDGAHIEASTAGGLIEGFSAVDWDFDDRNETEFQHHAFQIIFKGDSTKYLSTPILDRLIGRKSTTFVSSSDPGCVVNGLFDAVISNSICTGGHYAWSIGSYKNVGLINLVATDFRAAGLEFGSGTNGVVTNLKCRDGSATADDNQQCAIFDGGTYNLVVNGITAPDMKKGLLSVTSKNYPINTFAITSNIVSFTNTGSTAPDPTDIFVPRNMTIGTYLNGQSLVITKGVATYKPTAFSIVGNDVTFTIGNKFPAVGIALTMAGFTTGTYFNSQILTVTSSASGNFHATFAHTDASGSESAATAYDPTYTAAFTHTDVATTSEVGAYGVQPNTDISISGWSSTAIGINRAAVNLTNTTNFTVDCGTFDGGGFAGTDAVQLTNSSDGSVCAAVHDAADVVKSIYNIPAPTGRTYGLDNLDIRAVIGFSPLLPMTTMINESHTGAPNGPNIRICGAGVPICYKDFTNLIKMPALDQAQTWSLAQTFTVAPVFTDASGTRTALGLGTAATQNTGTSGATVPLLNAATNTFSGNIVAPTFWTGGNLSQAAWGTSGIGLTGTNSTFTDTTTPTGTLLSEAGYALPIGTIAASNTGVTITNLTELYLPTPAAGTNVTATNLWSLLTNGGIKANGLISGALGGTFTGGSFNVNAAANAVNIAATSNVTAVTIGNAANKVTFGGVPVLPGYTVSTLPSTVATGKTAGGMAYVTDATACTKNGALTGGGAIYCVVSYSGSAWAGS